MHSNRKFHSKVGTAQLPGRARVDRYGALRVYPPLRHALMSSPPPSPPNNPYPAPFEPTRALDTASIRS